MKTQSETKQSAREKRFAQTLEILDLKAQGWSDRQIRKEMDLGKREYDLRLKELRESEFFKREALEFVNETVHRLRWLRMKAFRDYSKYSEDRKNPNAAAAAFRRMVEIDTSLPKLVSDMGWSIDDLNSFYSQEKSKEITRDTSEAELYEEYRDLVKSRA